MTTLLFLENSELHTTETKFLEIRQNDRGQAIILNETIFHPQGGGQPADLGKITSPNGVFILESVRIEEDGDVWHFGHFEKGNFIANEIVTLELDVERRLLNTRLHSAGHLLDCAIEKLGYPLIPGKAFQFPPSPYVEYEGVLENPSELVPVVEQTVNKLIAQNISVQTKIISPEDAKEQKIYAPKGKPARIMYYEGFTPIGCGGTHVHASQEIGHITVRKIKASEGITKISYLLD